ncbi:uncharacterized protein [Hetaerina americana]|uniref:uncharacterized protein n=1 Tax=Hetaerina americana TaxID=62018 RepID=UPI003A7F34FA
MDDHKLIYLVHQHEELFNMMHKRYNDNHFKDKTWRTIGEELDHTGAYCKTRWFSLRDQYRRAMKNKRGKSSQSSDSKKWKYEDEMSFLLPFLQERELVFSSNHGDDGTNNCDEMEGTGSPSHAFGDAEGREWEARRRKAEKGGGVRRSSSNREPPATILMKYILKKNELRPDHIENFFSSLAATVRSLKPIRQNVVKAKIFSIVSEMELEQLMEGQA